jgi:hypothetical protein
MRADMSKVIVERPRYGSRARGKAKGQRRREQRLGLDNLPHREGIQRRCGGDRKRLNEHLGPLRRYLASQVGQPWDDVYADICAHLRVDSAVQDHVRDHVFGYVAVHVMFADGVLCHAAGRNFGQPLDRWCRGNNCDFYVCPHTRLLKRVPQPRENTHRWRREQRQNRPAPEPRVRLDANRHAERVNGQWRLVTRTPVVREGIVGWETTWRFLGRREIKRLIAPRLERASKR